MRITAPVPQAHVQTQFRPEASDRFVRVNLFVPYKTFAPLAIGQWLFGMLSDWVRDWSLLMFGSNDTSGGSGGRPPGIGPYILPHRDSSDLFATSSGSALDSMRTATDTISLNAAIKNLGAHIGGIQTALNNAPSRGPRASGVNITQQLASVGRIQRRLSLFDSIRDRIDSAPLGAPPGSSELGFLFLDRTRIRPVATDIGELFDSVPLIPGQESVYEVRTSYRKTTSVEDSIEREYETVLEQNSQTTETQTTTVSDQLADTTGGTLAADARAGLPAGESIPVDASLGLNSSSTFSRAATNSTQRSVSLAATVSNRVTSRLRQNHKSTVKTETQRTFETLSRNTIRSPNLSSPITLHYYKLLQRLELQQERAGTRLCWAPFIIDPGAGVRFRAMQARDEIFERAEHIVKLPSAPQPPTAESAPVWVTGDAFPLWAPDMGLRLFASTAAPLDVEIEEGDTPTGVFRVDVTGRDKGAVNVKYYSPPIGPDSTNTIRTDAELEIGVSMGELTADVSLSAQVLRVLPSYAAEMEHYQLALTEHEKEVSRIVTEARESARPAAESALHNVIQNADARDEILGAVFQQYVIPFFLTPGIVEQWHRLVDFDNVGYVTYPGWWRRGSLPLPQYGTRHFVNAAVARAFIPFRRGMEAEALYQLFDGDSLDTKATVKYNAFVKKIEDSLGDPSVPETVTSTGTPWVETVPVNGAHIEVEFSAFEALDTSTARQLEATVTRLEEEVAALQAENSIRAGVAAGAAPVVQVGPLR